jgi:hypothetical protein
MSTIVFIDTRGEQAAESGARGRDLRQPTGGGTRDRRDLRWCKRTWKPLVRQGAGKVIVARG